VARMKRQEEWIPITARVSVDSARRLRVTAARRGVPSGQVLDELIQTGLAPDVAPIPKPLQKSGRAQALDPWTVERLTRTLEDLGSSQAALARLLDLSQKAVNNWILNGRIPPQRQASIHRAMDTLRGKKPR